MNYNSENAMLCYDPLESGVGGRKVHGAPTSWLDGGCVCPRPPAPPPMAVCIKYRNT